MNFQDHLTGHCVYVLIDPRDGEVRYVGQSIDPQKREYAHNGHGFQTVEKSRWHDELRRVGLCAKLEVVESGISIHEINQRERHWVRHYAAMGCRLLNRPVGAIAKNDLASLEKFEDVEKSLVLAQEMLWSAFESIQTTIPKMSSASRWFMKSINAIGYAKTHVADIVSDLRDRAQKDSE